MNNNLPLYSATLNDECTGIYAISLVDFPATETDWVCFSKQAECIETFSIQNEDEHLLSGVVMLADTPIYRRRPDGYEFNIVYTKETIKLMAEKMLKNKTHNNIDIQHNGALLPEGAVTLVELYIKDSNKGISPNFVNVTEGSLIATYKVHDEELWEECKNGMLHGFSLAGRFSVEEVQFEKHTKKHTMLNKIKEKLTELLTELSDEEKEQEVLVEAEVEETVQENNEENVEETQPAENQEVENEIKEDNEESEGDIEAKDNESVDAESAESEENIDTNDEADGDGEHEEVVIENFEEEKPEEKTMKDDRDENDPEAKPEEEDKSELALLRADVQNLQNEVELLKGVSEQYKTDIESLKEAIQSIINKPAVEPIAQEFEIQTVTEKYKNNKAAQYLSYLSK